ncbi:MAG: hypothetical protein ACR2OG_14210 [Gemmatimonadaceae bacterium]
MLTHRPRSALNGAVLGLLAFVTPLSLLAQANPFGLDLGPYRAIRVSYATSGTSSIGRMSVAGDMVFTPNRLVSRSMLTATIAGKTTSQKIFKLLTPDSSYEDAGDRSRPPAVRPALRAALMKEFDALDGTSKRRLVDNLKRLSKSAVEELGVSPSVVGTKQRSTMVAGHACDVYEWRGDTTCVLSLAPSVPLRSVRKGAPQAFTATRVMLNATVALPELKPPPGIRFNQEACDCSAIGDIWREKHPNDSGEPSPRDIARFLVRWLGSAEGTKALAEQTEGES